MPMTPPLAWLAGVIAVLVCLWGGGGLARWAQVYADRLDAGNAPDARTLWGAARSARRLPPRAWRDGLGAACAGAAAAWLLFDQGPGGLTLLPLCLGLGALAWIDARNGLLPDALTLPLMLAGWWVGHQGLVTAGFASVAVWSGLMALACLYRWCRGRDGLGGGDVKCLAALAGWLGLPATLVILWAASVLGLLWWAFAGRRRLRAYPFGPCIALASAPLILCGPDRADRWVTVMFSM